MKTREILHFNTKVSHQICLPGAVFLGEGECVAAEVGLAQDALDAVHGGRLLLRPRHPRVRVREEEHLMERWQAKFTWKTSNNLNFCPL